MYYVGNRRGGVGTTVNPHENSTPYHPMKTANSILLNALVVKFRLRCQRDPHSPVHPYRNVSSACVRNTHVDYTRLNTLIQNLLFTPKLRTSLESRLSVTATKEFLATCPVIPNKIRPQLAETNDNMAWVPRNFSIWFWFCNSPLREEMQLRWSLPWWTQTASSTFRDESSNFNVRTWTEHGRNTHSVI